MESSLAPPQMLAPRPTSSMSERRSKSFQPLSNHGLPKAPVPNSPGGTSVSSHRFSRLRPAPYSPDPNSTPLSPKTPMSATSFSTFIESEPSTPAWSPQTGQGWDRSTLMLLSPVRSSVSTTPSSPPEPEWEMVKPLDAKEPKVSKKEASVKKSKPIPKRLSLPKPPQILRKKISSGTSLSSHPVKAIEEESQKENVAPKCDKEMEKAEEKDDEDQVRVDVVQPEDESSHLTAPLEKLATRMKGMLRRKSASMSEKKAERKRRNHEELVRMETTHWTDL